MLVIPMIWVLLTIVFVLLRVAPGDPVSAAVGGKLSEEALDSRRAALGLDRPLIVQYLEYLGNIFTGNFGNTLSDNRPVTQVLLTYGGATLELAFYALIVAFIVGIPLGMVAAYFRDRTPDAFLRIFAILCYATPVFFAGLLLKLIFGVWLGWLPIAGRAGVNAELQLTSLNNPTGIYLLDALRSGNMAAASDVIQHAVLPAVALGLLTAGVFLRLVRTNVIGTLGRDYVEAGRSRGVSEYRLLTKHAYRPALIPIITVIGLQIALLLGGAVLTETTFEWKGLGFQLAQYLQARDFVAVQGIVALLAVIVAVTNFIVDIIAALIDPRVRY
jgi:peptide/nickel transport system permease protein